MIPSEPSTRVFMAEYLNAQSWPYCSEQRGDVARYGLNKLPACTRGHRYLHYGYFHIHGTSYANRSSLALEK